jgi:hypothetical protein
MFHKLKKRNNLKGKLKIKGKLEIFSGNLGPPPP